MIHEPKPVEIINRGEFSLFAAQLRHDSIIVIEVPHRMTEKGRTDLEALLRKLFPEHASVIMDAGMSVRVIHPAEPPEEVEP